MLAQRVIMKTDQTGKLSELPQLPPNRQVEVILLLLDDATEKPQHRRPHPDIAGKAQILGEVFSSVPETDWFPQP